MIVSFSTSPITFGKTRSSLAVKCSRRHSPASASSHRGRQIQHSVLFGLGGSHERSELLGVERSELTPVPHGGAVDKIGARGVAGERVAPHSVLEHAVGDRQVPDHGPRAEPGGGQLVA
jgi:hypothetical protein